jgi:RIO kinase 1
MKPNDHYEIFDLDDELDNLADLPLIRNMADARPKASRKQTRQKVDQGAAEELAQYAAQTDTVDSFHFTYHASRHERWWLIESLGAFYEGHWIKDVLQVVKGGKEASVYLCSAHPSTGLTRPMIAAKVYRPRMLRNLRKDHLYREGRIDLDIDGREVLDDGMLHAMHKRTSYGQELLHTSWIGHEYKTMQLLHDAGVELPAPLASGNNAILMEYIGDEELPAPTLNTINLDPGEAKQLFHRVVQNIELMLANQRIHGDLSAYNILYWDGKIRLIDFPQAIHPEQNRSAFRIFERDVTRICEYFSHQGLKTHPHRLAVDLWTAHGHRTVPEVHPRLLDDQDEADRAYWNRLQRGQ